MSLTEFQVAIRTYEASPVWHLRAYRFRVGHGNRCDACGARGAIDVHHRDYGPPGERFQGLEPDQDLRALCRSCHDLVHSLTRNHGGPFNLRDATDYVIRHHGRITGAVSGAKRKGTGGMGWADAGWAWLAILWWVALLVAGWWAVAHITAPWQVGGLLVGAGAGILVGVALFRKALR